MPTDTEVVIAGGGPVGLSLAVELGMRGVSCMVIEPREHVSHARPRCKTINVRTMEHVRRWGITEALRAASPLTPSFSSDVVFCTSLADRELARLTGVLGLAPDPERFPELGQQAPQYVFEEVLRAHVAQIPSCRLVLGARVVAVAQRDGHVLVAIEAEDTRWVVESAFLAGCDGPRSAVRTAIGAEYVGDIALRPNFGAVFRAPELWRRVAHGRAVQYWVLNDRAPGVVGPLDGRDLWWAALIGVERERGEREVKQLLASALGVQTPLEILTTDPWTAHMQLVDHARCERVFLAGDASHLNPPWGGHGMNTGVGDAVDLGWKLAATLQGWGGAALLDSYEAERRPVQRTIIDAAQTNMQVLPTELAGALIDADGPEGDAARRLLSERIHSTKDAEFHSLDLVLDVTYEDSALVVADVERRPATALPGRRIAHTWTRSGRSVLDLVGDGLTLLWLGAAADSESRRFAEAARAHRLPLSVADLRDERLADRYGADLVLLRADQHVAWRGDSAPDPGEILDVARGAQTAQQATRRD